MRSLLLAMILLCAPAAAYAACPGTPTDCPSPTYNSALIGSASGGNKGSGSLNAQSLWINGTALGSGGGGLPNVSGTPASGNLTKFSGATSITNGDLTGDTTTSGTLVTTTGKVHGVTFPASPSTNTVPVVTGSNTVTYEAVPNAALANPSVTIGGQAISLGGTTTNQGTGGKLQLSTGSTTTNNCAKFDGSGNTVDAGVPCAAGSVTSVGGSSSGGTLTATGGPVTSTGTLNFDLNLSHANTWGAIQTFTNSDLKLLGSSTGATTFTSANSSATNYTATLPANTGMLSELNLAQTWTAPQTFTNSDILLLGSSTGATTFASANSSATNYTTTFPANTGTLAELNLAQTWTAPQTFTNSDILLLGSSTGATTFSSANASATNYTATLPANTGTLAELNLAQTFTATQSVGVETISAATSILTPSGDKNDYIVTLVHANQPFTLANMSNVPPADTRGIIKIIQSSAGGDAITTYGASYKSPGGTSTITLSSGANAIDIFDYVSDGTSIFLIPHLNFSH